MLLRSCGVLSVLVPRNDFIPSRSFYAILNAVFNRLDKDRVKEVGAERACAEWLLRCGAQLRWKDSNKYFTDYNSLPPGKFKSLFIEEVNADDAAIMHIGFPHFAGLKHLKKMRFHHCAYFDDSCVRKLEYVKPNLRHLEISQCDVSDKGLLQLCDLPDLQTLKLVKLEEVRNPQKVVSQLKECLPECDISYQDELST